MGDRTAIVLILLGGVWGNAWSDELLLVCDYPSLPPASPSSYKIVPMQVAVDLTKSVVTWDDLDFDVSAEISERTIKFHNKGFDYAISRMTGQIRFSNPAELARWAQYRKNHVLASIKQGKSSAQAHAEVDNRVASEFTAHEHVGECSLASNPKF